jgi:predicted phage replisome organizer
MNVSWLALDVGILDDSKIKLIRKLPGGDKIFILWIGLLCLAMKSENCGLIELSPGIPYSPEDLSSALDIEIDTVRLGLSVFSSEKFKMIQLIEGNTIEVCNFIKYQQVDKIIKHREQSRDRVRKFREARRLLKM